MGGGGNSTFSRILLESQISVLANYFHNMQTAWKRSTISVPVTGAFILTKDCSLTEWQEKKGKLHRKERSQEGLSMSKDRHREPNIYTYLFKIISK